MQTWSIRALNINVPFQIAIEAIDRRARVCKSHSVCNSDALKKAIYYNILKELILQTMS